MAIKAKQLDAGALPFVVFNTDSDANVSGWIDFEDEVTLKSESVSANIDTHAYESSVDNGDTLVAYANLGDLNAFTSVTAGKYSVRVITTYTESSQFGSVTIKLH